MNEKEYEELSQILNDIMLLSRTENVVIVVLSQLRRTSINDTVNKGGDRARPAKMGDFKGTGSFEENSLYMYSLYEYWGDGEPIAGNPRKRIAWDCIKARGISDSGILDFDSATQRWIWIGEKIDHDAHSAATRPTRGQGGQNQVSQAPVLSSQRAAQARPAPVETEPEDLSELPF